MRKHMFMLLVSGPIFADSSCIDGLYVGVGVGVASQSTTLDVADGYLGNHDIGPDDNIWCYVESGDIDFAVRCRVGKSRATRFLGAVEVGYGKAVCTNYYLGAVVSVDFAANKDSGELGGTSAAACVYDSARVRNDGVVPFIGFRLGYYSPEIGGLIGVRFGGAYVGSRAYVRERLSQASHVAKLKNFTPMLGVEFEKVVGNGFSVKLQADYRFGSKRAIKGPMSHREDNISLNVYEVTVPQLKTSGCSFKIMGTYRIAN